MQGNTQQEVHRLRCRRLHYRPPQHPLLLGQQRSYLVPLPIQTTLRSRVRLPMRQATQALLPFLQVVWLQV